MDKETFLQLVTEIGTCEDDANRRALLGQLSNDVGGVFDERDTLTTNNNNLTNDNEQLRAANMKLFLQVGNKTQEQSNRDNGLQNPPEKRKFEDLFNEKGELK